VWVERMDLNIMSQIELAIGKDVKEAIVIRPRSYDSLRWEAVVHWVRRIPATESDGSSHTSGVLVAISDRSTYRMHFSSHIVKALFYTR